MPWKTQKWEHLFSFHEQGAGTALGELPPYFMARAGTTAAAGVHVLASMLLAYILLILHWLARLHINLLQRSR